MFVSHSHRYDGDGQHELIGILRKLKRENGWFDFRDNSIRDIARFRHDDIEELLRQKIEQSDVVFLIARPAIANSEWILREVDIAKSLEKPIMALIPQGMQRLSSFARDNATAVVDWNDTSILRAVTDPHTVHISDESESGPCGGPVDESFSKEEHLSPPQELRREEALEQPKKSFLGRIFGR